MQNDYFTVVKKPLWTWITSKNRWLQFFLVIIAAMAVLANLLPLEMQKRIVNEAIDQSRFDLLILYCGIYLAGVIAATILKYSISVLQTVIGQRTVCEMRDRVYRHVLTLPLSFYRKTQPGLVVSALTTELATAGDFVGMAVAMPVTNLLMLVAFAGYLFWLNPLLAVLSFSIYPAMLMIVPIFQKRVNRYNKMRVDATRKMSSNAGEAVSGIHEIHANNTYASEGDKFGRLIKKLFKIRIAWNLYRYAVKRINSLFTNFGRFLVFAVGGYLAIQGRLELGVLVAFLSAQDKLYDPWKELIHFYQAYQTAQVTYNRTMGYFDVKPEHTLTPEDRQPYRLKGDIEVKNLGCSTEDGVQLLSDINLNLKHGEHMALVGFSGSGKSTLAKCIGQLYRYQEGKILIDKQHVSQLSRADMASSIGFVSQAPFIFAGSIQENLLYGYRAKSHDADTPSIDDQTLILQQTSLFIDVLRFGLDTELEKQKHKDLIDQVMQLREKFQRSLKDELADIVEFYDPKGYLQCSSVAENLMFGETLQELLPVDKLSVNDQFNEFLEETELLEPLLHWGIQLVEATLSHYENRSAEQEPSDYTTLIFPDDVGKYKTTMHYIKKRPSKKIRGKARQQILRVALNFIPNRHEHFELSKELANQIVSARSQFKNKMCAGPLDASRSCNSSEYLHSQSILANLLFGQVKNDSTIARDKINTVVNQLLVEGALLEKIINLGLQYQVGSKGANLSGGQQQKLAISRALIKKPPILIMDEATSGLDNESQDRIQKLLEDRWRGKTTLLAVVHRLDTLEHYDKIAVMRKGKLIEMGTYEELMDRQGVLSGLVNKS